LRFRITDIQRLGHVPPREMFDRAMTIVIGVLEAGTVRVGDRVAVPLAAGGYLLDTAIHLHTFARHYERFSAGQEPWECAIMWPGHRLAEQEIQQGGVIVPAKEAHADRR
jgi:hypothetical protein